jgi:hypothetical protein
MPGWGAGSFENEDAQRFLTWLPSVEVGGLRQMLAHAAATDGLGARVSGAVVAAAEVVAAGVAAGDRPTPASDTPLQIEEWVKKNAGPFPPDLASLARRAVERVRTTSELKELWLEADGLNEWSAALRVLEDKLAAAAGNRTFLTGK